MMFCWIFMAFWGAQTTQWFDFSVRPHQTGAYQADAGIVISGNRATLASAENWAAPGWAARIRFFVRNETLVQLDEYPVRIDLSQLPPELFDIAAIDGADLRLVDEHGNMISHMWLENFDFIARTGDLWFQLPTLPPGNLAIDLYFGNENAMPMGVWQDVFEYSSMKYGAWWPFPGVSQLSAAAFDVCRVQVGNATAVDLSGTPVVFLAEPGIIAANGPYSMAGDLNASDAPVPFSMAGTAFAFPAQRGSDVLEVFSPYGVAHVELRQNGAVLAQATVAQFSSQTLAVDVPGGSYQLVSDQPVLAYHYTSDDYDGHPLVPASTELWGAALGTVYVSALEDNTQITVYSSDIAVTTHTLSRDAVLTLSYGASAGSGPGLRLVADRPIGALSQADGTGGESVAFLPPEYLSREYILPRDSFYVSLTPTKPSTVCRVRSTQGALLEEQTGGAVPPPYPNKILFGALPAGARISCTTPVAAYYEDNTLRDERHLLSVKDHRPFVWPQPHLETSPDSFADRYARGPAALTTPTLVVPHRIRAWKEIAFLAPSARPNGTSLRFLASVDGGATWQAFDGNAWRTVQSDEEAMEPGYLLAGFPSLPALPSLTLRAILAGDGAQTPVLGPVGVTYIYDEGAARLRFAPIEGPVRQGVPFAVTIYAEDENGRVLAGYDNPVLLSAGDVRMLPSRHERFVAGRADLAVVMLDAAENVRIMATDGQASGISDAFDVTPSEAAALEKVAGDGQWGYTDEPLPVPLLVRLVDQAGEPLAAMPITFSSSTGKFDGTDGDSTVVETSFGGYAAVLFTPDVGVNTITASYGDLPPATFVVRGDERHPILQNVKGSNCSQSPGTKSRPLSILWLLGFAILMRRCRFGFEKAQKKY